MRRIIVTEAQIKKLLGENVYNGYLTQTNSCEMPHTAYSDEVSADEMEFNPEYENEHFPITNDKIAKSLCHVPWGNRRAGSVQAPSARPLTESNQDLDSMGKTFHHNNTVKKIANNNQDVKLLKNIANEKGATSNTLYVRKNRLNKMKDENPEQFKQIGGKEIVKDIDTKLNAATQSSASSRELKKDLGIQVRAPKTNTGTHSKTNGTQSNVYIDN